jgi:hypothetical protein
MPDFNKLFFIPAYPVIGIYGSGWWEPEYQRNGTADIDSA